MRTQIAIAALLVLVSAALVLAQQPPDRLTALQREAESLTRQERTLLNELRQRQVERDLKAEDVRRTEAELAEVMAQRADAASRIAALESRIATATPGLSARLVELYKLGRPGYLRLLFDMESLQAATRGYRTVSALVQADRRRVSDFRGALDDLRRTEQQLADRSSRVQALQVQAVAARQAAERAVADHNALIAHIDARRDLNAALMGELQAARAKLAALAPSAPASAAVANVGLPSLRGSLDWPASGAVTARFGSHRDARFGTTTVLSGIEIAAAAGSPAAAVHDGVIAYAEPFAGFGNVVIVDHGQQAYSLYGYLDSVAVARGARVARGQAVGTVGQSPAGKPGLYFELRVDGKPVDPVQWLKKKRGP